MDSENLISLVEARESLWNQNHKHYHNRQHNWKLWRDIASILGTSVEPVRQKWRGLRDTFRRELQKDLKRPCEDPSFSKWHYFRRMMFLKDQVLQRKRSLSQSNPPDEDPDPSIDEEQNSSVDAAYSECDQFQTVDMEFEPTFATPSYGKKHLNLTEMENSQYHQNRKKPLADECVNCSKLSSVGPQDDDHYFALSLVPYLRKLPTHRKMVVRAKFLELLAQEHEVLHRSSNPPQQRAIKTSPQYSGYATPSPAGSEGH